MEQTPNRSTHSFDPELSDDSVPPGSGETRPWDRVVYLRGLAVEVSGEVYDEIVRLRSERPAEI